MSMSIRKFLAMGAAALTLAVGAVTAGPALTDATVDAVAPASVAAAIPDAEPDAAAGTTNTVCVSILSQTSISVLANPVGPIGYRWESTIPGYCSGAGGWTDASHAKANTGYLKANGKCYGTGVAAPLDNGYETARSFRTWADCLRTL